MKNLVASRSSIAVTLVLAALAAGCSTGGSPFATKPIPATVVEEQLTPSERDFLMQAAQRAMYDLEVSRLAADRATNPKVRSYAQMVANHRAQANNELTSLMRAKGVPRPTTLAADKATKLHRLAALRPSHDFDLGYVRVVGVEEQTATIALFERAKREARSRELKVWIDKTLPVLRNDLAAAQSLAGNLAG
jgi:putative membrane protein